jgi:DNA-binding NarL/FixJ family response regulator
MTTDTAERLFEREAQIAAVAEAVLAAVAGTGRGVLLEGPAGIGKTSLLRIAAQRAGENGLRVLEARGDELEADLPWGVVVQLYGGLADGEAAFAGAAGLSRTLFEAGAGLEASRRPDPFPILHGLHWLTSNLAEEAPLLILVDDAHRADPQSLRFASYLLGRIDEMPAALVVAARTGDPGEAPNAELLAHLRERTGARASTLRPLGAASIEAIVATRLPASDPAFRAAVATRVAGNPFFCAELLREAGAEGIAPDAAGAARLGELQPEGIARAIAGRLARLGPDARRMAAAVAVLGGATTIDLARRLAGLDEATAVTVVDALLAAEILTVDRSLGFVHPVVAEAVETELGAARRRALHLEAARLLHERGSPADAVATHLLPADGIGAERWAVPILREAAAEAMARGAPERAETLLDRALAEAREVDAGLLLEAGYVQSLLYRPGALELFRAALDGAEDREQRAAAFLGMARCHSDAGDYAGTVSLARTALESAPPDQGGPLEAEIMRLAAMVARLSPDLLADYAKILEPPRHRPSGRPTVAEYVRLVLEALDLSLRGDRRGAAAGVERARVRTPAEIGEVMTMTRAALAFTLLNLGRYDEVEEIGDRALAEGYATGNGFVIEVGHNLHVVSHWVRGDVVRTLAASEWIAGHLEGPWETETILWRAHRSLALLEAGRDAEAKDILDVPAELEESIHGSFPWLWLPYGRAHLAFAAGEPEVAAAEARLTGERQAAIEVVNYETLSWRPLAVRALSRAGRREEALALAAEDVEQTALYGAPRAAAVALATAAAIEGGRDAQERLLAAIADLDGLGARLDAARARLDLGMLLRRRRRPRDARPPLAEAIDIAGRLGARRLAGEAEGELRAAGGRPRRPALTGPGSLTPSQRRVAELAAQGLSNPEVAQTLFVGVRTVETHLTATYAKLEIESRDQLGAALRADDRIPTDN